VALKLPRWIKRGLGGQLLCWPPIKIILLLLMGRLH
jgi:hypothetical protein